MAGNDQVAEIIKNYEGRGTLADDTPPTPPREAVKQFKMREGFAIDLMASEPEIGQPLFVSWDSKGRLWVMQYLQYQFPAGLKIVEYDNHLRAQFDKVPEPPPLGAKGADKITVFEDTDGDGFFDRHRDVITGLNIATSVETGHGGIWVTNPPYLLFYPDPDGDGVPNGDPEIRLAGFGIEDTHSVMNNLEWGPDGWLYGVNGSTTTGKVKNPATGKEVAWQGQMVWRYHPDSHEFEIYGEGGGNTFSLEIDAVGRVFSGTNNGNTRGMYYPQGSYGIKGWGKHGPLTNPYAFGYFQHMKHEGDKERFPQAFCIYEGGLYPDSFDGKIIAPNSLLNRVYVSARLPDTSTYRTIDEPYLAESPDRWFRPVFAGVGPDGCVYMGDWYDTRLSHVRPVDDWHKESGRVYRVRPEGTKPAYTHGDLSKLEPEKLTALFADPNRWVRRRAVLELGWRGDDDSVLPKLLDLVRAGKGQESLEALWAANLLGGLTEKLAIEWLGHQDEHVRRWVVRLIGDRREAGPDLADTLSELAGRESQVQVRSQLAASAKRLPPEIAIPIVRNLLGRDEDAADLHLPLMNWWAIEAHAEDGRELVMRMVADPATWKLPLFREEIALRLMRRYAMAGGPENFDTCAKLLSLAPDEDASKRLMTGLQLAFQGTQIPELPPALTKAMDDYAAKFGQNDLVLGIRRGDKEALKKAIAVVSSSASDPVERIELAKLFGETGDSSVVKPLLGLLSLDGQSALKRVALQSLANYDDAAIATTILGRYGSSLPAEHDVRSTADRVLAGRIEWARAFLEKIDLAHIKDRDISPDVVQLLALHKDPEINAAIARHWPAMRAKTTDENLAEIARIKEVLKGGQGSPEAGRLIFQQRCMVCHKLFEEGNSIAPDLTGYERGNLDFWLPAIIDPSLEIREGFGNYVAKMKDGRLLIGMIAEQNPQSVTLKDAAGQTTLLSRGEMESLEATPVSLMPPGLLTGMTDGQLRDFFSYLRLNAK
ncbi:MAG: c-type cytochrome [Akkermansiaceae bacterium]|nr:c-type cytochrome [Akkermansiaceae bacterium]MCP5550084.1 c-type cytochrome [Akkermansiaceae bacterium]